ncbi:MAG: hypothetical protein JKY37_13995 [Nannocystaceae bacterium]|nr:hypothetical protein [Nannocystaceae bacterium]
MSDLTQKVADTLWGLKLESPEIEVHDSGGAIFATVVSGSFTDVDEAERQKQVWAALRGSLSDAERVVIEFVFTIAPGEKEAKGEAV